MDRIISVVIPTFDRKALTDRAIESVSVSQPEFFEIIVVDDCGTVPYEYANAENISGVTVRRFRTDTNGGPGLARKLGVEKAEGIVIAFLDSDDVFETEWLDTVLAEVLQHEVQHRDSLLIAGNAFGASAVQDRCARYLASLPDPLKMPCVRLAAIAFNPFYTPSTAISKKLCAFSVSTRFCEDYFTNAMAIFGARRVSILPMSACTISRSPGAPGGLSEIRRRMWKGEFDVRKNILFSRRIPLRYRALVPLGMLYAVVRNIVKSRFDKPPEACLPSNIKVCAPERQSPSRIKVKSSIAILGTRGIPARYGGFETFAEKLAVGLSERGFEVTVFCELGQSPAVAVFHGAKLRYLSAWSLGPLSTVIYDLRSLWAARNGYDVVYMLGYGAAPFCLIPRLWNTEVWINPDGLEWARAKWGLVARYYFRLMEWTSIRAANRVIADAEAISSSLASRHGKLRSCTVIPYGCEIIETPPETRLLAKWNLSQDRYFLVVCRIEPENHVIEILKAFQQSRADRELIVVGNHLAETPYAAQVRTVRDPRIRLIGAVYDQAKLTCLRYHSFAYVHGHSVGGTNPSLLEAMGCGNVIIAHDNPFNRETLGLCGSYFADVAELTNIIDGLAHGSMELSRLKETIKARARAKYHWPDVISHYVELLERVHDRAERT